MSGSKLPFKMFVTMLPNITAFSFSNFREASSKSQKVKMAESDGSESIQREDVYRQGFLLGGY